MKYVRAAVLLPGIVTVVIPAILVALMRGVRPGWGLKPPWSLATTAAGLALIATGGYGLYATIRLLRYKGEGTLAPWDPTQKLVVHGVYRQVRNPMISSVFAILLGEAVLLGSRPVLIWFLVFVLINGIYIPLLEEQGLEQRFGEAYRQYKRNVPRWLPRRTPLGWTEGMMTGSSTVTIKRSKTWQILLIAGLAGLLVCGLFSAAAAWYIWNNFLVPPGEGAKAERGYQACAPIITALEGYRREHGGYPQTLEALSPKYLMEVPAEVNEMEIIYRPGETSYSLEFSYVGPGMNHCTYTPETEWKCSGYY